MSKMKELYTEINELLDEPMMSCQQIADRVGCPVGIVNSIVEQRHDFHIEEAYA